MRRTSLSLAAGLAAAAMLMSVPAQAAVGAKDVPSQSDIQKSFPDLAGGTFTVAKAKELGAPGADCGTNGVVKVKSGSTITGVSATGYPVVVAGAAEMKSAGAAKSYLASYKKFAKSCANFTEPIAGGTVKVSLAKAPKLGQSSLATVQETSIMGITSYSATVLIRDGKRVASVVAVEDAPVSASVINKLAKVAAKKMK